MNAPFDTLQRALTDLLDAPASAWLSELLSDRALLTDRTRLRVAFARVARKLAAAGERSVDVGERTLPAIDAARALLLLRALEALPASEHVALVSELYRTGELREQQSILRSLPLLADGARFAPLAIEACRTNSPAVFAAIASDNPFPAQHFPDLSFNQLVLKAIFLSVPVERIVDLPRRVSPELRRMVSEYASERRAAGRSVPPDVDHVIALSGDLGTP